jgi:hypothetical protein
MACLGAYLTVVSANDIGLAVAGALPAARIREKTRRRPPIERIRT